MIALGIAAALIWITIAVLSGRGQSLLMIVACAAAVMTPMMSLTVVRTFTYGDILIVATLVPAALFHQKNNESRPLLGWVAFSTAIMLLGGMFAMLVGVNDLADAEAELIAYATATTVTLLLAYLLNPTRRQLCLMAAAYGVGGLVSCIIAFGQDDLVRPLGLTTQSNHLGISAMLACGMWFALSLSARRTVLRLLCLGAAGVAAYGVLESGSRAALGGTVAAIGLSLLGSKSGKWVTIGGTAVAGLVFALTTGRLSLGEGNAVARFLGQDNSAVAADTERGYHYRIVEERIAEHPILGNGFGESRFGHSVYLQMWSIAGMLGILAAIILIVVTIAAWRRARRNGDRFAVALWSFYGGYLICAVLSNQMWDRYLWLALTFALLALRERKPSESSDLGDGALDADLDRPVERRPAGTSVAS